MLGHQLQRAILTLLIALLTAVPICAATNCKQLDATANERGERIPGYASGRQVIGSGRLAFYSAPHASCALPGVFILPGETVNAYVEHAGYTSVMYLNIKTDNEATGWVLSSRLRNTGLGISPRQE